MRLRGTVTVGTAVLAVSAVLTGTAAAATPQKWSIDAQTNMVGNESLDGIAATGPKSAWAVGTHDWKPLVYRWNGTGWRQAPAPAQAEPGLSRVAASSDTNVWAFTSWDPRNGDQLRSHRWDGKAWHTATVEKGDGGSSLGDADVLSPSDVWLAVSNPSGDKRPLRHWDGKAWTGVAAPVTDVTAMHFTSATSGWAIGHKDGEPRALRWDGKTWKATALPQVGSGAATLNSVLALSATNVWAVGSESHGVGEDEKFEPIVLRWNGSAWSRVAVPSDAAYQTDLKDLASDGSGGFWVRGGKGLVNHNAGKWSTTGLPAPANSGFGLGGLANAPGTRTMLAVGTAYHWDTPDDDHNDGIFFQGR